MTRSYINEINFLMCKEVEGQRKRFKKTLFERMPTCAKFEVCITKGLSIIEKKNVLKK